MRHNFKVKNQKNMELTLENADIINKIIRAPCEKRWKEALNNSIKIWYKKSKIELIHMNLKLNNNRLIGVLKRNNTNKNFQKKFWFRKYFFLWNRKNNNYVDSFFCIIWPIKMWNLNLFLPLLKLKINCAINNYQQKMQLKRLKIEYRIAKLFLSVTSSILKF